MDKSVNGLLPDLTVDKKVFIILLRYRTRFQKSN